jgi:DNA-binding GntR family transcriptional regulator
LAFIYYHYTKVHREAPAETELQEYFQVSPLTVLFEALEHLPAPE